MNKYGSNTCNILFFRVAASAAQFKDGLRHVNFLDYLVEHPEELRPLFVHQEKELTAQDIIEICDAEYGWDMSLCEETFTAFKEILQEVQGTVEFLKDVIKAEIQ